MRTTIFVLVSVAAAGCGAAATGSYGVTAARYRGDTQVVFTNATPAKMCELRMSFDHIDEHGDNWLPKDGLASGESLELRVQPGTYKATWTTCKDEDRGTQYAATLWHETAFSVNEQETQVYAFAAGPKSPTTIAPVLTRNYQVVHFQGQPVGPIDRNAPVARRDAFAAVEAGLASRSGQQAPAREVAQFEPFDASEYVESKPKKRARRR